MSWINKVSWPSTCCRWHGSRGRTLTVFISSPPHTPFLCLDLTCACARSLCINAAAGSRRRCHCILMSWWWCPEHAAQPSLLSSLLQDWPSVTNPYDISLSGVSIGISWGRRPSKIPTLMPLSEISQGFVTRGVFCNYSMMFTVQHIWPVQLQEINDKTLLFACRRVDDFLQLHCDLHIWNEPITKAP